MTVMAQPPKAWVSTPQACPLNGSCAVTESPGEAESQLRGLFADVLEEAAELRRRNNALLRASHSAVRPEVAMNRDLPFGAIWSNHPLPVISTAKEQILMVTPDE